MVNKFRLTDETITEIGYMAFRIQALKDFGDVKAGDLGGFVESEHNLSQNGKCWVYDDAVVYGDAHVYGNGRVRNNASVYGSAQIYGDSEIKDKAQVYGYALIDGAVIMWDESKVFGQAVIHGAAKIGGNVKIYDHAGIWGNNNIYGNAQIYDNASIYNNANIYGNSKIHGYASVFDKSEIYEDAEITENAKIYGYAYICGDAKVTSIRDYMTFQDNWSYNIHMFSHNNRFFTWTRSNNMWTNGEFHGTSKELIKEAKRNGYGKGYIETVRYVERINGLTKWKRLLTNIKSYLKVYG